MQTDVLGIWNEINLRLTEFIRSKTKDPEIAKDIVQDVFLKVFSKNEMLREPKKLVAWIYQVTRNEIIDHFRKLKNDNPNMDISETGNQEENLTGDLIDCLQPMVDTLPEKYKEALILSDLKKVSQKEIAQKLNISYSGAKSRVQRGREMLRSAYEQCCDISVDVYGDVIDYQYKPCPTDCEKKCD